MIDCREFDANILEKAVDDGGRLVNEENLHIATLNALKVAILFSAETQK